MLKLGNTNILLGVILGKEQKGQGQKSYEGR